MRINNPMDMGGNPLLTGVAVSELLSGNGTSGNPLKFSGLSVLNSSGSPVSGEATTFKEGNGISFSKDGKNGIVISSLAEGGMKVVGIDADSVASTETQYVCLNESGLVLTLPKADQNSIVAVSSQTLSEGSVVHVVPHSGDTISGGYHFDLDTSFSFIELVYMGSDWKPSIVFSPLLSNDMQTPDVTREYVDSELKKKHNLIDVNHPLDYSLLSNAPKIPTVPKNVGEFANDIGYQTEADVSKAISSKADISYVNSSLGKKQDAITSDHKLDYGLISGVPSAVGHFSNDVGYQTEAEVSSIVSLATSGLATKAELSGKANVSDLSAKADKSYLEEQLALKADSSALNAKADVSAVESGLAGKQDAITSDHKLDYGLIEGVPSKVSELNNDAGYQTEAEVSSIVSLATSGLATKAELSGKANASDIPSVSDSVVTVLQMNAKVGEFSLNQPGKATVSIDVNKAYVDGEIARIESQIGSINAILDDIIGGKA